MISTAHEFLNESLKPTDDLWVFLQALRFLLYDALNLNYKCVSQYSSSTRYLFIYTRIDIFHTSSLSYDLLMLAGLPPYRFVSVLVSKSGGE